MYKKSLTIISVALISAMIFVANVDSKSNNIYVNNNNPAEFNDDFAGSGSLIGYTTLDDSGGYVSVARSNNRYRALVTGHPNNQSTTFYHADYGRGDYKELSFPFDVVVTNVGIGDPSNSQQAPIAQDGEGRRRYAFAGLIIRNKANDAIRNFDYAFAVIGYRNTTQAVLEAKQTISNHSGVSFASNVAQTGVTRADIRVVGHANRTLTLYHRPTGTTAWNLYRGDGVFPLSGGQNVAFDQNVYIGLVTYAWMNSQSMAFTPFVGTADSIELIGGITTPTTTPTPTNTPSPTPTRTPSPTPTRTPSPTPTRTSTPTPTRTPSPTPTRTSTPTPTNTPSPTPTRTPTPTPTNTPSPTPTVYPTSEISGVVRYLVTSWMSAGNADVRITSSKGNILYTKSRGDGYYEIAVNQNNTYVVEVCFTDPSRKIYYGKRENVIAPDQYVNIYITLDTNNNCRNFVPISSPPYFVDIKKDVIYSSFISIAKVSNKKMNTLKNNEIDSDSQIELEKASPKQTNIVRYTNIQMCLLSE
jgi:hypothetical protein